MKSFNALVAESLDTKLPCSNDRRCRNPASARNQHQNTFEAASCVGCRCSRYGVVLVQLIHQGFWTQDQLHALQEVALELIPCHFAVLVHVQGLKELRCDLSWVLLFHSLHHLLDQGRHFCGQRINLRLRLGPHVLSRFEVVALLLEEHYGELHAELDSALDNVTAPVHHLMQIGAHQPLALVRGEDTISVLVECVPERADMPALGLQHVLLGLLF
mmetsp:Transcript_60033/g.128834  ORF Transcript_60033/g.128834 Transcript_60033/m.128834 type:complete len:216 (+) Transcript_60033:60-707(+)